MNEMKSNDCWNRVRVKVAAHGVTHHLSQLIHGLSLGKDCMA